MAKVKGLFGFELDKNAEFTLFGDDIGNAKKVEEVVSKCKDDAGADHEVVWGDLSPHGNGKKKLKVKGTPALKRSPDGKQDVTGDLVGDMTVTLGFGPGAPPVEKEFSDIAYEP